MTPHTFEALLFLKVNRRFWNRIDVVDARQAAQKAMKSLRLEKRMRADVLQANILVTDDDGGDD